MAEEKILMISLTLWIFFEPFLSFLLSTLKSSLTRRRSVIFTLTSVSFGASLEDDIAGIVGELRIFVNAVNVDTIVVLNDRMLH